MAEGETKSKRPADTRFKQQNLPAWQPILTAGTVLPAFFAIGIAFIPLGVALLLTSNSVLEVEITYTSCQGTGSNAGLECGSYLEENPQMGLNCHCKANITLDEDFNDQVYLYYGLTNYYQNHRRYVKSRDDHQLKGNTINSYSDLSGDCEPFKSGQIGNDTEKLPIAPCGAIANSLFNDTFQLFDSEGQSVNLKATGIAWATDKGTKFRNPSSFDNTINPPGWQFNITELGSKADNNWAYENEDLIVWMRTAALPTFRKLHRIVGSKEGLKKGTYTFDIQYNYPVKMFDGEKKLVLTTTSWMGGKNPFLGYAYLVVGSISIIFGFVFLIIHIRIGHKVVTSVDAPKTPGIAGESNDTGHY